MSSLTRLSEWLLRLPVVWGGLGAMAFYALIVAKAEPGSPLANAFAGEPWPFKALVCLLCFTGLAALAMRLMRLAVEFGSLERNALPPAPAGGLSTDAVDEQIAELDDAPRSFDDTYLGRRLRRALMLVRQRGSADLLEGDLAALAADDLRQLGDRYAAVRLAAAAAVLVGFAGFAAGSAAALHGLAGREFDAALPDALRGVVLASGCLVQAVILSLVLMFAKLGVDRTERRLLAAVDEAAGRQLVGRFATSGPSSSDPNLASIRRLSEQVLGTVQAAAEGQRAAMAESLAVAARRWDDMAGTAGAHIHRTVGEALASGLKEHSQAVSAGVAQLASDLKGTLVRHAEILSENVDDHAASLANALEHHAAVMTAAEQSLAVENQRRVADLEAALGEAMLLNATRQEKLIEQSEQMLREMQEALVESAGMTVAQQEQLVKQGDVLLKVVDATGQVRKLEEALNSNLLSLAASHNFEHTVTSLAAAVQLLSVRLRQPAIVRNEVDLSGDDATSQAA